MTAPTFEEAEIYKSRTIQSQVRAAVELDHPVYSGNFSDDFAGAAVDTTLWFQNIPDWGEITVGGGAVSLAVTGVDGGISPPWMQTRHNLAFPLRRDTDWQFDMRCRFPVVTGFGVFVRICGTSFRDAEAVWGLKCNEADGLGVYCPDGFTADNLIWSTVNGAPWRRYRVNYDASAQLYICGIDQDDDGVYETVVNVPVAGRYADAIVLGNSTAIQGNLGAWTQLDVDSVSVTGTAEAIVDPYWAAPFTYDGTRFSYLPLVLSGRVSCDKDNIVDAAELVLGNRGLTEDADEDWQLYTASRFWNRRAIIEARAGDGNGGWTNWAVIFDGRCAEKQLTIENGTCTLSLPIRDRYRAIADDMEIIACYSDAVDPIPGVVMNLTVAEIIRNLYGVKCGLPGAAYSVVNTPVNTPRNYNIFRQTGQQAVKQICDEAALACYQIPGTAQIIVAEWDWGNDVAEYSISTDEEIMSLQWTESAFDVITAEQLSFENTNGGGIMFQCQWPPHLQPWYGPLEHATSIVSQTAADHDDRPVNALTWWARNRKLGSVTVMAHAQFWVSHNDEVRVRDDRFLGLDDNFIIDGWEHSWEGESVAQTTIRLINPHPDEFLRENLMS
jgi:hypothetical protein